MTDAALIDCMYVTRSLRRPLRHPCSISSSSSSNDHVRLALSYLRAFSARRRRRLLRHGGTPRPRQAGSQRRSQRGSKHDRSRDFTPDLRVSRIAFAPASIRVSAARPRRPDIRRPRRKPNCRTLLETFSHFVAALRACVRGRLEYRHIGLAGVARVISYGRYVEKISFRPLKRAGQAGGRDAYSAIRS